MKRFKLGFTLSELMVALGVLGVIVAIVTPAIMSNRPNKNKMLIKKSFFTVEQIVSSLINDETLYPDNTDKCNSSDNSTCYWGFDDTSDVKFEGETYGGDTKFMKLFQSKLNISKCINDTTCATFYTNDGTYWNFNDAKGSKHWKAGASKVGTFPSGTTNCDNFNDSDSAGCVEIGIRVGGGSQQACDVSANNKCNYYKIQILANGKMRIHPTYTKANDYIKIQSSLTD